MHAGKVFANNPQSEQLCSRKDRDDGSEEGKSWNGISTEKVADRDIKQDSDTNQREAEPYNAGELQWHCAEPGHHIHRVGRKFSEGVTGRALLPGLVMNLDGAEPVASPSQQHVNGDERAFILAECIRYLPAKCAKCRDLSGNFCSHDISQGHLGCERGEVAA